MTVFYTPTAVLLQHILYCNIAAGSRRQATEGECLTTATVDYATHPDYSCSYYCNTMVLSGGTAVLSRVKQEPVGEGGYCSQEHAYIEHIGGQAGVSGERVSEKREAELEWHS